MIGWVIWRFVDWRLRRALPPDRAAAVVGDLLEDFDRRARRDGRLRAEWWLLREVRSMTRSYRTAHGRPGSSGGRRLAAALAGSLGDLRMALRTLGRQPMLLLGAVLPVALAIAASTALFSLTDGLLFRELRLLRDPGSLVAIDFDPRANLRHEEFEAARDEILRGPLGSNLIWTRYHLVFDDDVEWRGTELAERVVSPNFFQTLGVPMAAGRGFLPSDLDAGGPPPVVLGHDVWRAHFGADPAIAGATVTLADAQVRVVGVAPRTFDFPGRTNVWSLFDTRDGPPGLPNYARAAGGVSIDALREQAPYPLRIRALAEAVRPNGALAVAFLFGATALLLLVSWLQVGALLFSRAAGRSSEIGIRLALGAGRARLLRAFAAEGAVVAALALVLAWLAAPSFVAAVVAILPEPLTAGQRVEPDMRTLAFASAIAGAGLLLLAVLPMDLLRRANPLQLLRGMTTIAPGRWSAGRVRSTILLAQVAVTVVLLYVAGLVAHSFLRISTFDLGFDPDRVLVWSVPRMVAEGGPIESDPAAREAQRARMREAQTRQFNVVTSALDELRASPEISAAAASRYYPVIRAQSRSPLTLPDLPGAASLDARTNNVTPEFFDTLGIRLLEGETFSAPSLRGVFDVVVVNETLARQLGQHGPVIGQRITISSASGARIVGVVADYVDQAPDQPVDPQVFLPTPPERAVSLWMGLVRANGDVDAAQSRIRAVVERTWGAGVETTFTAMDDEIARATAAWRGRTIFLSLLAALCLPLALVGLLGALSYDTRSRSHEIAVRLALGAEPGRIRRRVVGRALGLVGVGLVVGVGGGWLVGRLMDSYLFGVSAVDPTTTAAVGGVLLAGAWLAALAPAWRASRTDPAGVLREG
jgi:putative ABC transport system permease protein